MDWTSIAVGYGGLMVGGFTVYLSYKARTSSYREKLYEKQLRVCAELIEHVNAMDDFLRERCISGQIPSDKREAGALLDEARTKAHETYVVLQRSIAFTPGDVHREIEYYLGVFGIAKDLLHSVVECPTETGRHRHLRSKLKEHVEYRYHRTVRTIRDCLGTDRLSGETIRLVGEVTIGEKDRRAIEEFSRWLDRVDSTPRWKPVPTLRWRRRRKGNDGKGDDGNDSDIRKKPGLLG